jgi:AraC family transcriptional regulator
MRRARILIREAPLCELDRVLLSTACAPLADILKIEQHRVGPGEIASSAPEDFLIVERLNARDEISYRIAGEKWKKRTICPGEFSLVSAGTKISLRWTQPAEVLVVAVNPAFISMTLAKAAAKQHHEFRNPQGFRDTQIQHIVSALRSELAQGCPSGRMFGESLATALVVRLAQQYSVFEIEVAEYRGGLPWARLNRVMEYVHAHLLDDTSLSQLAAVVDLSPHHFSMLSKKAVGLAPHRYVMLQKIQTAKRLLVAHRDSLAEIAHQVGFSSQAHFSTAFRQMTRISPQVYGRHFGVRDTWTLSGRF